MGIEKTNESESQMTYRKANYRYQNQVALLTWDKFMGYLCYCMDGIRYGSGVSSIQAFMRNLGTWEFELTNTTPRGGVARSSDEVNESSWSKGATLIGGNYGSTKLGGNHDFSKTI